MAEIDIIARLKLAGEGFNREFKQNLGRMEADAKASSNRIKSAFSGLKGLGAGLIAGIGVSTFVNLAKDGLEYASSLGEVSQQLGVSTKALQEYRYVATQVGISQEKMDAGLARLTKSIGEAQGGNKKLTAAFAELKVGLTDANGKTRETGDVLHDLVAAFSQIQDPAKRARLETELFGKAGQQLDTLLAGGVDQVDNLRSAVRKMGGVLTDEQIRKADEAADKYAALKTILSAQIAGVVADNAGAIMEIAKALGSLASSAIKATEEYLKFQRLASKQDSLISGANQRIDAMKGSAELKAAAKVRARQMIMNDTSDVVSDHWWGTVRQLKTPQGKGAGGSLGLGGAASLSGIDFAQIVRLAAEEKALKAVTVATVATTKAQAGLKVVFAQVDAQLEESIPKYGEMAQEVADLLEESRRRLNEFYDKTGIDPIADQKAIKDAIDARTQKEFDAAEEVAQHRYEVGRDAEDRLANMWESLFSDSADQIWKNFEQEGKRALAQLAAQQTISLLSSVGIDGSGLMQTFAQGTAIGSTFSKLTGTKGSRLGSGIGGVVGSYAGPVGELVGSMLGSLIGGALKKTKKGTATLAFSNGSLGVGSTSGNSRSRIEAASGGISALSDTLEQIASALGGTITSAGSVSIGIRNKKYVVDPTGQGRTKGSGVLKFKDEADAIRAATLDALKDGVIDGISEASKRILAAGKDLQKSIEKASLIEAIPKALKARLDPVGAAIDEVNERWKKTIAALKEGGATAQQMADAQKLYNLEMADAKTVSNGARASLKEFLDGLNFGSASPLDLRTQEASARAALQPFLDQIQAGTLTDQAGYQQAASTFLDIERQINGSTRAFFVEFEKIQAATAQAIASIDAAAPIRTPTTDLFAEATATATQATANISQQALDQLAQIRALLSNMGPPGTASGFIGAARNFAFA